MGGTHWENQDDRSLPLPFSIQAEGDVLLLASDKEAEGISILIKDCARRYGMCRKKVCPVTAGGVTSLFMDSLSAGNYWAVLSWEGMSGVYAFTK